MQKLTLTECIGSLQRTLNRTTDKALQNKISKVLMRMFLYSAS
jgi:hypothetical protein